MSASAQAAADAAPVAPEPPPQAPQPLMRAPGAPPRTTIDEPIGSGAETQYFFLHDDNFFAFQANGGLPPRVKFQFSIRFDVMSIGDTNNFGFNIAYTQKSFWDMLAFSRSSPFVESNYRPEGFFSYRPRRLERFREIQLGVQHESNGLGEIGTVDQSQDSRGWNSVFVDGHWGLWRAQPASDAWFFVTPGLRVWYPFAYAPSRITDAIGWFTAYVDLDLRVPQLPQIGRLSLRLKARRHSLEANAYYPLVPFLSDGKVRAWAFAQLFTGEAERLITYDQTVTHVYVGIGFQ